MNYFKLKYIRLIKRVYNYTLAILYRFDSRGPKVYLLHDILDNVSLVTSEYTISYASFKGFFEIQISKGYRPVDFKELTDIILKGSKSLKNCFTVTFDDASESMYTKAYPFLKKHNIPFIIFITVELIDRPGYLTTEELIELSKDSLCTVGSHGSHHVVFRQLSRDEVETELIESKKYLEDLTNRPVEVFAFPYGTVVTVSAKNVRQLRESAYKFAFSAIPGSLEQKWFTSRFFLPRTNVDEAFVSRMTMDTGRQKRKGDGETKR